MTPTLLLVYNADEGLFPAIGDAIHKIVSPETYGCSLCAITYGAVAMRSEWKAHLRSLPYPARFFHRQGFRRAYPGLDLPLPAILLDDGTAPKVLLDAKALGRISGVGELIMALDTALREVGEV